MERELLKTVRKGQKYSLGHCALEKFCGSGFSDWKSSRQERSGQTKARINRRLSGLTIAPE